MLQNETQQKSELKIQKVKNYDAKDIKTASKTQKTQSKTQKQPKIPETESKHQQDIKLEDSKPEVKIIEPKERKKTTPNGQQVTLMGKQGSALTKFLICLTYLLSAFVVLYVLPSWWWFLGMVGVAVPLLMFFVAKKDAALKKTGGRLFFINLCATLVSGLFWVLYLTTRRFGIGFLSSMFRALQIGGAVVGVALVVYFFLDFATSGKTSLSWIAKMTQKTEDKMSSMVGSKAK